LSEPSREEAIAILEQGNARLVELLEGVTDDALTRPATIGGGEWSAKDLVGHVAFWEELALGAIRDWRSGQEPAAVVGVDEVNAANQERKRTWPPDQVQRDATQVHERLVAEIRVMDEETWVAPAPAQYARHQSLGVRVGGLTGSTEGPFRHAWAHLPDLQAYVASLR
jgi:uncharacterized protein (TIGR03083 family)